MDYTLDEILWEFNLNCNKNCSYCGSADLLNKSKLSSDVLKSIRHSVVKNICDVKPKSVTITGGEPSVCFDDLIEAIKYIKTHSPKTTVKLLTNGYVFSEGLHEVLYDLVDCIGLSINEYDDMTQLFSYINRIDFTKTTMITNFGTHNISKTSSLKKVACLFNCWQVQLTMKDGFYLSIKQIKDLYEELNYLNAANVVDIVFADNFNTCPCFAGQKGCSITFDGFVIPCLSQRAWRSNVEKIGSLYFDEEFLKKSDLKNIWNNCFDRYRVGKNPCCKDFTQVCEALKCDKKHNWFDGLEKIQKKVKDVIKPKEDVAFVYGVVPPPIENDFPPMLVTYGVVQPKEFNEINISSSYTTLEKEDYD